MSDLGQLNQQIADLQKTKQGIIDRAAEEYREAFESLKWLDGLRCNFHMGLNAYGGIEYSLALWSRPDVLNHVREASWSRGVTIAGDSRNYLENVNLRLTYTIGEAPEIYSSNPAMLAQVIRDHRLVISQPTNLQGHVELWKTVAEHAQRI